VKAFFILLIVGVAGAQQPSPSFDAASIKQNRSALDSNGGGGIRPGGKVSASNAPVRVLILMAYGLQDYQLSGGPAWVASTGYDVEARPASAVDSKTARLMLQNLLAERLSLKVHHEDAMVNGFHLVVDKGGSKLKPSDGTGIGFRIMGSSKILGAGDMQNLVSALTGTLRAPVEDHTGLTGKYDLDLQWTPDSATVSADEPWVSVFAAIREQLGLSLEATKVKIDRVVIDRVERPTEN
jgi:uncharacterized protein (TIGR03435 family)